jgi:DNA-directed RNA polymerase subunit RPC12/RpoP
MEIIHSPYFMEIIYSSYFLEIIHSPYFMETIHSSNFFSIIHSPFYMEMIHSSDLWRIFIPPILWRLFIHPICGYYFSSRVQVPTPVQCTRCCARLLLRARVEMERGGAGSLRLFYGRSAAAKSVAESTSLLVLFHSTLVVFCFKYVQIRMRCDEISLLIPGSDNLMLFLCWYCLFHPNR